MKDYALIVGINSYPELEPSKQLSQAVNDAKAVHDWLVDNGADPAALRLLTSEQGPGKPTHNDVDIALVELIEAARTDPEPEKRFFLYFSGHGLGPKRFSHDLCLAGWSDNRQQCALDHLSYRNLLAEIGLFDHVYLFLDCCRTRGVESAGLPNSIGCTWPGQGASGSKYFLAHAAEYQKPAWETATEKRSAFTEALLTGLRGGAADDAGEVRLDNLMRWLDSETVRLAKEIGYHQRPEFQHSYGYQNPLVCSAPLDDKQVTFRFAADDQNEWILEDDQLTEIHRGPADAPWTVPLKPGAYSLYSPAGAERLVRVRPGTSVIEVAP